MRSKMTINEMRKARRRIEELHDKDPSLLRIDELIKDKGISKQLLSNITGISIGRINTFYYNSWKNITAEEICILSAFFNIPIRNLFRNKKAIIKLPAAYMRDLF